MTTRVTLSLPEGGTKIPLRVAYQVFCDGNWIVDNWRDVAVGSTIDPLYVERGRRVVIEDVTMPPGGSSQRLELPDEVPDAKAAERDRLREALREADGCFEAALAEGWLDALADGDIERIRDLWSRRISYARQPVAAALQPQEGEE